MRRRVPDQAFHAAQRFGQREDPGPLRRTSRARAASPRSMRDHAAEAAHLAAGQLVLRMATAGRGSRPSATSGASASQSAMRRPLASCCRIRSGSVLVPRSASQQSIGPGTAPAAFWRKPSRSARSSRRRHQQPAHHVAVAVEVLGRGVEDDVGARTRAGAGSTAWRRCCPPTKRSPRAWVEVADGREVGQDHHRVGGRLAVDQPGGRGDGPLDLADLAHVHEREREAELGCRPAPSAGGCRRRRSRRRRRGRRP